MKDELLADYIARCSIDLYKLIQDLARQHFESPTHRVVCTPSMRILGDVIKQWDLELRQLAAWQPNGIRPTKSIGALSFWIKKLKPVRAFTVPKSKDFPGLDLGYCTVCGVGIAAGRSAPDDPEARARIIRENFENELGDVNERIAIILAIEQLVDYATGKDYYNHRLVTEEEGAPHFNRGDIKKFLQKYFQQKLGRGDSTIYDNLIFNMRYRTFATHHIVHILDQLLFALTHHNEEKKQAYLKAKRR